MSSPFNIAQGKLRRDIWLRTIIVLYLERDLSIAPSTTVEMTKKMKNLYDFSFFVACTTGAYALGTCALGSELCRVAHHNTSLTDVEFILDKQIQGGRYYHLLSLSVF